MSTPSPTLADVATAVVAALNEHDFSQDFVPVRKWLPAATLEELKNLTVTVVPRTGQRDVLSRATQRDEVRIDIGIQHQLPEGTDPEAEEASEFCDAHVALMVEISDLFGSQKPVHSPLGSTFPAEIGANWLRSEFSDPMLDPEHLRQFGVCTGVVSLFYRLYP